MADEKEKPISARHLTLVLHYLDPEVKFNKREACRRAGFSDLDQVVNVLFNRKDVQREIAKRTGKIIEQFEITQERVLQEVAAIAFARLGGMIVEQPNGTAFLDFSKMKPEDRVAVAEFTTREYKEGRGEDAAEVKENRIKFHNKLQALELLGKYLKIFKDNVEVSGAVALHERIAAGRKRIAKGKTDEGASD